MTPSEQKIQKRLQDDCVALDQGALWLSASVLHSPQWLTKRGRQNQNPALAHVVIVALRVLSGAAGYNKKALIAAINGSNCSRRRLCPASLI